MKKYGVILADPPWRYSNSGISGAAEKHYNTMSTDELCALPIGEIAKQDSVLIMWATWPMLEDAIRIINAWGFKYKTGMPWVKLRGIPAIDLFGKTRLKVIAGQGWWFRGVTEPILISVRGNARPPDVVPIGLMSERFEHSKKPTNAHEYAELLPGPYLELFARRPHPGWDVWGNEVETSIEINGTEVI